MPEPKEYRPFGSYGPDKGDENSSSHQESPGDPEPEAVSDELNQSKEFTEEKRKDSGHYGHNLDEQMRVIVRKMAGDMTFVGVVNFIIGILISLSIIGALIGIPVMVYSFRMIQSGGNYRRFSRTGDVEDLYEAFFKQRKSFFTQKVILIVVILLTILQIILVYLFFDMLVGDLMRSYPFPMS